MKMISMMAVKVGERSAWLARILLVCYFLLSFSLLADDNFQEFYQEGVRLAAAGQRDDSIRHLQAGLQEDWSDNERRKLLNYLGSLTVRINPENARLYFYQAILTKCSDETEYYRTFVNLGEFYRFHQQWEAAIGACLQVARQKNAHPSLRYSAHFNIGRCYLELQQQSLALQHFQAAVAAGQSVAYKFNYQAAEQAAQKLLEE
ncbi:MAG: hypothetical protein WCT05_15880, partial [Lentisphaeria bacterium]